MNRLIIYSLLIPMILISSCQAQVKYTPPGLPISITINHRGEVSVNASASIITPMGEFEIEAGLPIVNQNEMLLIIRDMRREARPDMVWRVAVGRSIQVITNGRTVIQMDSNRHVLIDISDGQVERIDIIDGNITQRGPDNRLLCDGIASRFHQGDWAVVDFNHNGALRILRDYTGGANQTLVLAYDGDRLELLQEAICYNGQWYWYVYFPRKNTWGWASEGTSFDVYMCPESQPECSL